MDELGHHQVRGLLVDLTTEEDDAVVEKAGVDVKRALAASRLLDDHRDQCMGFSFVRRASATFWLHVTLAETRNQRLHYSGAS